MPRLTQFLLRHKLAVVAAWLVVLVAGVAAAGVVPGRLSQEFSFPGEEGYEANVAILEAYGNGGARQPAGPGGCAAGGDHRRQPRDQGRPSTRRSPGSPTTRACGCWPGRPPPATAAWWWRDGRTVYGLVWGPYQGPDGGDPALAGTLADGLRRALPAARPSR